MNLITGIFFYKCLYWQKSSIYLVGQKLVKWQGVNFTDFLMGKFSDIGKYLFDFTEFFFCLAGSIKNFSRTDSVYLDQRQHQNCANIPRHQMVLKYKGSNLDVMCLVFWTILLKISSSSFSYWMGNIKRRDSVYIILQYTQYLL